MRGPTLFDSFLMAGYECASQRRGDGRRLDLLESTGHARWVEKDYRQLHPIGIRCAREGLRWHLIEARPGHYDWSSFLPMLHAAQDQQIQVIWDLSHYGYPDHLDIWRPSFVEHFARFAGAFARLMKEEGVEAGLYSPINEISFWSWAGGDVGYFNPGAVGRGQELKQQLVRASIAAIDAIREQTLLARFVQCDPLIHVVAESSRVDEINRAEAYRLSQFEALDLLTGREWPGLGGREDYLDIIGVNVYPNNQWFLNGRKIIQGERRYRPLAGMLAEIHRRYARPLFIAETGAEGSERLPWLSYVTDQVAQALRRGVPVEAICWYPLLYYPGWEDDRHCPAGVFGYADAEGHRQAFEPLYHALSAVQARFTGLSDG